MCLWFLSYSVFLSFLYFLIFRAKVISGSTPVMLKKENKPDSLSHEDSDAEFTVSYRKIVTEMKKKLD